jgi:hypothetical protein
MPRAVDPSCGLLPPIGSRPGQSYSRRERPGLGDRAAR